MPALYRRNPHLAKLCIRIQVEGKVQGVFFRKNTQKRALELGLTGFARNLPDGSVEVLACGEHKAVMSLCDFVQGGPPGSEVTHTNQTEVACQSVTGFEVL
ncbi:acylphosphatase [Bowmanella denitrificans]|uniref:acylphosphatase n=1 Tax=Bowmanella denitrificans TaxID=366582 RepID=UPI0031D9AD93